MTHATRDHARLTDSFDTALDELSGIRRRPTLIRVADPGADPAPVHVAVQHRDGVRHYYLGVRFEEGIIPAEGWEQEMLRDGVRARAIVAARRWLDARAV